ncbi:MAG: hypothetical protein L3J88_10720 [Gammaproteobacteria bacterium]|nr:hypothetical protein [Gammaproteobacteria bacterium]MCF6363791.1 hypothetical protein [Gammaproteobacteria bacterium]
MVAVKKGFIVCLFWAIVTTTWAKEDSTFISKQQEDEIINLAYTQMMTSLEELERKIDECDNLGKYNILSPTLFQSLPLTKQEARTALGYFSLRAQDECEGLGLWAKVAVEYSQFKYIEKFYKGKNIIETEGYLEIICCMISRTRFYTKWKYLKISPEIRKKLERIPALQKPFNSTTTAEKMGLF